MGFDLAVQITDNLNEIFPNNTFVAFPGGPGYFWKFQETVCMHFESGTHVKKLPKSRGDEIDDGALYDVLLEEINKTAEICDYETRARDLVETIESMFTGYSVSVYVWSAASCESPHLVGPYKSQALFMAQQQEANGHPVPSHVYVVLT